jgi:HD-GYP domain-containing protein (c-di-GMP phosphodiesterase class II)
MSKSAETAGAAATKAAAAGQGASTGGEPHTLGRRLVRDLYSAVKAAEMFEYTNVVTREALATLHSTLRTLVDVRDQLILRMASECLFLDETRLRFDFTGFAAFKFVVDAMRAREIGAVVFRRGVEEQDLRGFLRVFLGEEARGEEPFRQIDEALREAGIETIHVEEMRDLSERQPDPEVPADTREASITTYFKSIFVAKQVMENLRGRRSIYLRKARRLVQSIVDLVTKDETTLLALTQIKNFDDFLFTHSANVCVLSVALGQNLGLPKNLLAQLGLAALLHDVGMTEVPRDLLHRADELSDEDRLCFERHTAAGALLILRDQGITAASVRSATVAFQHHWRGDGSGFPSRDEGEKPGFLSSIVAIADAFDRLTTPQESGKMPLTPEGALQHLLDESRGEFDPLLVKMFVNTVGVYPLGSVVKLSNGEVGIVHSSNPDPEHLFHPVVKITHDATGEPVAPRLLDLSQCGAATQEVALTIEEVIPASEVYEDVEEFTELL